MRLIGMGSKAWDEQFEQGIWGGDTESPEVIQRVSRLAAGGRIVEFGCGHGQLPRNLPPASFSSYLGIDISLVAVEEARRRAATQGISGCEFVHGDMETWRYGDMETWSGDSGIDLIVLLECLYYLKGAPLIRFLKRCMAGLSPNGRILVVIHSARKHHKTIEACRSACEVVGEELVGSRTYLTLAPSGGVVQIPFVSRATQRLESQSE